MNKLYSHVSVQEVKINKEFSPSSSGKIIKYNKKGIKIDIHLINRMRMISKLDPIMTYREYFLFFCNQLNINKDDIIRWDLLLDKSSNNKYATEFINMVKQSLSHLTTYHFYTYPKRLELYDNLVDILDSSGKEIAKPTYIHESLTGRTSIKKGFNFLTCSKRERAGMKSKNKDYNLIEIDFKSCEPSLYLRSMGIDFGHDDVYKFLSEELKLAVKDRQTLKRGILSVLYGASNSTSQKLLGGKSADLNKIKTFFQLEEFESSLKKEFKENGCIYNMYGRPVYSDKSLINKWIQSSAVDFCNLAFLEFVNNNNVNACYTVHDSITVECLKDDCLAMKGTKTMIESSSGIELPVDVIIS